MNTHGFRRGTRVVYVDGNGEGTPGRVNYVVNGLACVDFDQTRRWGSTSADGVPVEDLYREDSHDAD